MVTLRSNNTTTSTASTTTTTPTTPITTTSMTNVPASTTTTTTTSASTAEASSSTDLLPPILPFESTRESRIRAASVIQVVQPIKSPTLKSFGRLDITEFRIAFARYKISTRSHGIQARTELECLDPKLLVVLSAQYLDKPEDQITDADLKNFLDGRLSSDVHHTEQGMEDIFRNLKMDLKEKDPIQRVTKYNVEYLTLKNAHGLSQLEDQVGFRKQLVNLLLKGVRPSSLRDIMCQKTKTTGARSSPKMFFEILEEWAPLQDVFHGTAKVSTDYVKNRHNAKRKWNPQPSKGNPGKKKRKLACLICGKENHLTTKHRGASKEDIDKAFEEYRKDKVCTETVLPRKANSSHVGKEEGAFLNSEDWNLEGSNDFRDSSSTNNFAKNTLHLKKLTFGDYFSRPLPMVKINGSPMIPCQVDDGTDKPVISEHLVQQFGFETYSLKSPLKCELALKSDKLENVVCTEGLVADLELTLPKLPSKPIVCQRVHFVIVRHSMPIEVLLGKSWLKDLGIDIEEQLASLAEKNNFTTSTTLNEENTTTNTTMNGVNTTTTNMLTNTNDIQDDYVAEYKVGNADTYDFQNDSDVSSAIRKMLQRALDAGLPSCHKEELKDIVMEYDIWRSKLGPDPPAKVPPMKINLKPDAKPTKAANRRYPPMYREFMHKRLTELEKFGMVYRNNQSRYSSAVHVVPKVDKPTDIDKHLRWTVDTRAVNAQTETMTWPMPNLDVVSESIAGSKYFASLDFMKGYWQMPLHEDSQEIMSMVTDRAVYTPTRVIQGSSDSVMYFQSTMQNCFEAELYKCLIIWLDDFLAYAPTLEEFLEALRVIFRKCAEFNLKLNPDKCDLFALQVKFCGKIFSSEGVQHDPNRVKALLEMPPPTNAAELQQYLSALNWMRSHMPDFARVSKPLRQLLEKAAIGVKKKASVLKRVPLKMSDKDLENFGRLNQLVAETVMLAHPLPGADFCLFTDASDSGWGAVLFQIADFDDTKIIAGQDPQPLYFLSGCFSGASERWSIPEKEAFAIVEAVQRLDFMLIRTKPFYIMTDHKNLEFIFGSNVHLKMATRHKISRWALSLSSFDYIIQHIEGESNVWADLLSRWGKPPNKMTMKTLALHPFEDGSDFEFPSIEDIWESQRKSKVNINELNNYETIFENDEPHTYVDGKPWIPQDDEELINRVLVVAHCGISGHRGVASTTRILQRYCFIQGLRKRVLNFMKSCLLCLQTKGGKIIPRPLGRTIQATKPNEVLHFDYYYVGEATNGWTYVLVMKDGLSHFVELVGCDSTGSEVVVEALLDWFKRYGIVPTWVSDQPTHYKNAVVASLTKRLQSSHHFVTAYCPWANGPVERPNRDLGTLFRILLAEFKLPFEQWPQILPVVQYVMNQTPTESLHGYAAIEMFMAREPSTPLREVFNPLTKEFVTVNMDKASLTVHLNEMKERLALMHQEATDESDKIHNRNKMNSKGKMPNFSIGDYVLWSRVDSKGNYHKLQFIWRGPFRITHANSDYVFTIQNLVTNKEHIVHSSRLKYYHDRFLNVNAELKDHIHRQGFLYTVDEILEVRWNTSSKIWELLISWEGFEDEDNTWEPLLNIFKDMPTETAKFLNKQPQLLKRKIRNKHKKTLMKYMKKYSEVVNFLNSNGK